jgi:septal ring factor EnvC (AmiA/AmiB activator)
MSEDKNYLAAYIQKLEQYYLEVLRRAIDSELKMMGVINTVKQIEAQFEESQRQVAIQNDIMEQAGESIKNLTVEKESAGYEIRERDKTISDKNRMINEMSTNLAQVENEKDIIINQVVDLNKQILDLKNENKRQNVEMATMLKEKKTK